MRRVSRYIVRTVAASMLLVLSIVLSLDLLFAFIAEVDEVRNDYQLWDALVYVMTTLPRRVYDYLPLGAFMGCLIGLGALAKNSELVVLRAAGVSTMRIAAITMKPAVVIVVIGLLLGEFVAPYTEKIAQSEKAVLQGAESNIVGHRGLWHRENDVFMHFNAVEPNGVLHGVSLQTYDEARNIKSAMFAKRAIFQRGGWQLESVVETQFVDGRTEVSDYATLPWQTELKPSVLSVLVVKPEYLSISGLYAYTRYLKNQDLNAAEYMVAFWKKVLQPLSTSVLVMVAISFVFGPLRSVTMGFRVFSGVVVGLLFKYLQDFLGPSSIVFGFDPVFATLIPVLICFLSGVVLLRRAG